MLNDEFPIPAATAAEPAPQLPEPFTDPAASWPYWTHLDTADRGVPDEWVWERLRNRRNALLADADWTQTIDAPVDQAAWAIYRQALRDLPANTTDPRTAVWPEPPA